MELQPYFINESNRWRDFAVNVALRSDFFDGEAAIIGARSPCRLDLMGDFAEYGGGIVAGETVGEYALTAVQRRTDGKIKLGALNASREGWRSEVVLPISLLFPGRDITSPIIIQDALGIQEYESWMASLLGCLHILVSSGRINVEDMLGVNILVDSDIPQHSGLGEMSALEVALVMALRGVFNLSMSSSEIATICMKAEQSILGELGSVKDPMNCILGRRNEIFILKCQPHEPLGYIPIPKGWRFIGIETGMKHSRNGSLLAHINTARQMGLSMMQSLTGESWGGYLVNISEEKWEAFRDRIPSKMSGKEFCVRQGSLPNARTEIDLNRLYNIRSSAEHAIIENNRVKEFIALINLAGDEPDEMLMQETGALMYDAHAGFQEMMDTDFPEADLLVHLSLDRGPKRGIYGAKSAGGVGGVVVVLCQEDKYEETIKWICVEYERITGIPPRILPETAPGALDFGWMIIQ